MKRSKSSKQWMMEHVNDVYVQRAKSEGYRSRAAYKLLEIAACAVRNLSAEALDLKSCILRSRRRIDRWEFSARLFSRSRPG